MQKSGTAVTCFRTTDPCILLCEDLLCQGKCVKGIPVSFSLTMTLLFCDPCERWGGFLFFFFSFFVCLFSFSLVRFRM